jgi:hypothetical protein
VKRIIKFATIILVVFSSCKKEDKSLSKIERGFLNYSEFLRETENRKVFLKIPIDISKNNTFDKIDLFIDSICLKYKNNDSLDKCWDLLAITYNYIDFTFKPNKENKYNINIPAIEISCDGGCLVDFDDRNIIDINYNNDSTIISNPEKYERISTIKTEIIQNKIDSIFNRNISELLNKCADYKDYVKKDEIFSGFIESRIHVPLYIRIHVSEKNLITDIEPLFAIIYKSYLKSLDYKLEEFTKHKLKDLSMNEFKLFGRHLHLYLTISRPIPDIRFIEPIIN